MCYLEFECLLLYSCALIRLILQINSGFIIKDVIGIHLAGP